MSGRRPGQTGLETWIRGYLKKLSKTFNRRSDAKFIEKAIMLINIVFGHPCCDDPENVVNLITPNDNELTHTVKQLLQRDKIIRREYRLSLFRILDLLNDVLYGKCCVDTVTVSFTSPTVSTGSILQLNDIVTGDLILSTVITEGSVQTFQVPAKYFGEAALIQVSLNVISFPGGETSYQVIANSTIYLNTGSIGVTNGNVFTPLQSSYTINVI